MALHGREARKQDVSLGTAGNMRPGLLVNGSAGGCGVKDQVSYNRVTANGDKLLSWSPFVFMQVNHYFVEF